MEPSTRVVGGAISAAVSQRGNHLVYATGLTGVQRFGRGVDTLDCREGSGFEFAIGEQGVVKVITHENAE
ncbi:MAG: hypothetical protein DMG57_41770 [Acidobacteria bacterium]|nr:MAG: hypothetical protein DMG57_41770 [Acidobacteriota bacterium]